MKTQSEDLEAHMGPQDPHGRCLSQGTISSH
ncbi:hypothetical protein Nmel_018404 [Mimus melanotis]